MFALKWILTNKFTGSVIGVIGLAVICVTRHKPVSR